jgi:DNA-binding CsgD family transcriptional regulator
MAVEYGKYQDGIEIEGAVIAESNDAWLILDGEVEAAEGETVNVRKIENQPHRLRVHTMDKHDGEDVIEYTDMTFDNLSLAALAFGLWERCGPFNQPEGNAIPIEIATDGQAAIAAYLRLGNGYPNPRSYVAEQMGITKQTVSNYCNRIKWKPGGE